MGKQNIVVDINGNLLKHNVHNVDNFVDNLKGGVKYGEFSKSSMYIRDRI